MTMLEAQLMSALQATFEALNANAPTLPAREREKVEAQAKRIFQAKTAIHRDASR